MNTVILETIDDIEIIKGFGSLSIDPIETVKQRSKKKIVYFEPLKNEKVISDKLKGELELIISENPKAKIDIDSNVYEDNRGVVQFIDDNFVTIEKLGEKVTGKLQSDFTAEELEDLRFNKLTKKDKTKEFKVMKDSIINEAVNIKNRAEIEGIANPVKLGQDHFNSKLTDLKSKYGVK